MSDTRTKVVTAADCHGFTVGERLNIADLSEEDAVAIFGRPVYEMWLAMQLRPQEQGTLTVTGLGANADREHAP